MSVTALTQHTVYIVLVSVYSTVISREETWNTVPVPKNSRTIDPNKIPKITKVLTLCGGTTVFTEKVEKQFCFLNDDHLYSIFKALDIQ